MSAILNSMPNLGNAGSSIRDMIFNKKFIIILVLIVIFLGIAFYVYNTYIAPRINPDFVPNREFDDDTGSGVAELYLFAVDWCPYSKKAKPIWNTVKKQYNNKKINNHVIKFKEVDGEKNDKELESFENKYLNGKKIDGYPSIYMVKDSNVIEYEAKPDRNVLGEFINSVL